MTEELNDDPALFANEPYPPHHPDFAFADLQRMSQRLLRDNGVIPAVAVARAVLFNGDPVMAERVLRVLDDAVGGDHSDRYIIFANLAYANIAQHRHEVALEMLQHVRDLRGDNVDVWHTAAQAFAHHELHNDRERDAALDEAKRKPGYMAERRWLVRLYPSMARLL